MNVILFRNNVLKAESVSGYISLHRRFAALLFATKIARFYHANYRLFLPCIFGIFRFFRLHVSGGVSGIIGAGRFSFLGVTGFLSNPVDESVGRGELEVGGAVKGSFIVVLS